MQYHKWIIFLKHILSSKINFNYFVTTESDLGMYKKKTEKKSDRTSTMQDRNKPCSKFFNPKQESYLSNATKSNKLTPFLHQAVEIADKFAFFTPFNLLSSIFLFQGCFLLPSGHSFGYCDLLSTRPSIGTRNQWPIYGGLFYSDFIQTLWDKKINLKSPTDVIEKQFCL